MALVNPDDPSQIGTYEYGPFGEPLTITGYLTANNPFRFSTKYTDEETGLLYFGYRYYNPSMGRWINRDLAGETGGGNIYGFVGNQPNGGKEYLGLWNTDVHYNMTLSIARTIGYKTECALCLAVNDELIDSRLSSTQPFPVLGDFSWHFDTDPSGNTVVQGARQKHVDEMLKKADDWLKLPYSPGTVGSALIAIGNALHPMQDMYSHTGSHNAATPFDHAPSYYCKYMYGDANGERVPKCIDAKKNNKNWSDGHRPDSTSLWPLHYRVTYVRTQSVLETYWANKKVQCECKERSP